MSLENIGPYRIVELLGSGAMGDVYKATDSRLFDRVVAVKVLAERFARNENARARFHSEAEQAAHLDHPNIVKIYEQGEVEGRPFFVMEFLDGVDLARFMKYEPSRTVDRSLEIARQLAEALEHAHRHNVVHRDVKPANVMVMRRGDGEQIKLVDFGIIQAVTFEMSRNDTQPRTAAYNSPEQLRNEPVDRRSDLFSLGIILYELFTNVHPFDAPSEALIAHAILEDTPGSPKQKNPRISPELDLLILKLLEKDRTLRPQSAVEIADVLRRQHRRLASQSAAVDSGERETIDDITRDAVDRLVGWAQRTESEGRPGDALRALEKALMFAPDSEPMKRRINKLREIDEQAEQRRKRVESYLRQAHTQIAAADALATSVTVDPDSAVRAYTLARDSYESALKDDDGNAEALAGRIAIDERLRALAERASESQRSEREIDAALDAARTAVASAEIAGGARAPDLASVASLLDEADSAIDRVLAAVPKSADARSLRGTVANLRNAVADEQARRDQREIQAHARAAAARHAEEARARAEEAAEAERRRVGEDQRRATAARPAEEAARKAAEAARREAEAAAKAKEPAPARAAQAAQKPAVQFRSNSFMLEEPTDSKRGLIFGVVGAVVVIAVALGLYATKKKAPDPVPAAPAEVRDASPEPAVKPEEAPPAPGAQDQAAAPAEPPPSTSQATAPVEPPPATPPAPASPPPATAKAVKPLPPPPQKPKAPKTTAVSVATPPEPAPNPPQTQTSPQTPARAPSAASRVTQEGRIVACVQSESRVALGFGYRVSFSFTISGAKEIWSAPTDGQGCALVSIPLRVGAARVRLERVDGPDGNGRTVVDDVAPIPIAEGSQVKVKVRIWE
jgi:serine/threonine protein kinase